MNHLAHALLAGDDPGMVFGGLLADFVRGAPDPALPPAVRAGIRLHRRIDRYTDAHPVVAAARLRFHPPLRRYAGIQLDVWFDHCLAREFPRWSALPLVVFSARVRGVLAAHTASMPPRMHDFARAMQARDLPAAYADRGEIAMTLTGLSGRLRRANPLATALPVLVADDAALTQHFHDFFPALIASAATLRAGLIES
jgi:acyl carrier protein phosphodiesterase